MRLFPSRIQALWAGALSGRVAGRVSGPGLLPGPHRWKRAAVAAFLTAWLGVFLIHLAKPLPDGISTAGPMRNASGMEFLFDLSYRIDGEPAIEQEIFRRVLSMIDAAEEFVVIDMFFFDGLHKGDRDFPALSSEMTDHILSRRVSNPDLKTTLITDEINNFYGAYTGAELQRLEEGGVQVITTRLSRLRDSNPAYSAGWRMLASWVGTAGPGWLPNPFTGRAPKVTVRAYLKALNFKANHRKLVVTDKGCLLTSANPHDASGFHSNIAFAGTGPICADLLEGERAVASFSGGNVDGWPAYEAGPGRVVPRIGTESTGADDAHSGNDGPEEAGSLPGSGFVQLVTEGKILTALLGELGSVGPGDRVDLAMFYLSERRVVEALLEADQRGASLRLVLDPNKDAFGREKGGIPNRQVARELVTRSDGRIAIRWYDTHGEQFHTKLLVVTRGDSVVVMGGSANLTRRNIGDYNLEADLRFILPREAPLALSAATYFDRVFTNKGGEFTLPFERYRYDGWVKRVRYRLEEFTGFCSY